MPPSILNGSSVNVLSQICLDPAFGVVRRDSSNMELEHFVLDSAETFLTVENGA